MCRLHKLLTKGSLIFWTTSILYLVLGTYLRLSGWFLYDDAVGFVETSRKILDGSLKIYSIKWGGPPDYLPAYLYPPLFALIISPVVVITDLLKIPELAPPLIGMPILLFDILAAYVVKRICNNLVANQQERSYYVATIELLIIGIFKKVGFLSQQEGIMLFFLLLGFSTIVKHPFLGGFLLGLSFLTKQTSIFALIPFAYMLLISKKDFNIHSFMKALVIFIVTVVTIFTPFILANIECQQEYPNCNFYDTFIGAEQRRRILNENVWKLLDWLGKALLISDGYDTYYNMLRSIANPVMLSLILILTPFLIIKRRPGINSSQMYKLIAGLLFLQLFFSKWVGRHYYIVPFSMLLLADYISSAHIRTRTVILLTSFILLHNMPWNPITGLILIVMLFISGTYLISHT